MSVTDARPCVENDNGRLEICPGAAVPSLAWGSWTFRWTVAAAVEPGGGLEIILVPRFPTNRWSLPQVTDPIAPGYVTARSADGVMTTVDILRWPLLHKPHGATLHIIQTGVGGRTLMPGETIEVTYGDQRGGSLGTQVQQSAREVSFPVFVSSGQEPKFFERFVAWARATDVATLRARADFNPSLRVIGGQYEVQLFVTGGAGKFADRNRLASAQNSGRQLSFAQPDNRIGRPLGESQTDSNAPHNNHNGQKCHIGFVTFC